MLFQQMEHCACCRAVTGNPGGSDRDLRHHPNAALVGAPDQHLDRRLPMLLGADLRRQRLDIARGIAQGDKFVAIGQGDRILKAASPTRLSHCGIVVR